MKRQIIAFLALFGIALAQGQEMRPAIRKLAREIAEHNQLEQEHVGYAGVTTDQYLNFIKLRDKATTQELLALLGHKNSVVKGYTSWALADNKYPKLYEVLAAFLKSGEISPTQHGCIVSKNELASEFYYRVYYQNYENDLSEADSIFFRDQVRQMDSVILYTNKKTRLLHTALKNNNANPKTYDRIKELAEKKEDSNTLAALAEYHKESDIPFIISRGILSFKSISVFPHPAFWDFLLGYRAKERSLDYFLAISSYKNNAAVEVLSDIYAKCDSAQVNKLDEALIKNYSVLFQDLLLKIWEEHKTIDLTITEQLIGDCPEKSSRSFAIGLLSDKKINLLQFDHNYGTAGEILPLMLQAVSRYNKDQMISICNQNIITSQFTQLEPFLGYIKENKLKETTDVLLQRLAKRNSAFEIFHMAEALLSFNDPETNKKLTDILVANQTDWDWGNWSGSFRKTLKASNIELK